MSQPETLRSLLARDETLQQADRELLAVTTDPAKRQTLLHRIAGREGLLAARRRSLAAALGEYSPDARRVPLRFRVSEDERAALEARAEADGLTLSQYIRRALGL